MDATTDDRRARPGLAVFFGSLALYCLFNYGGVRSPDSEVVFRTGLALAENGDFAVQQPLEAWKGFGTAPGRDGRQYSIFGPAEPVAAAPLIAAARALNRTGWYEGDWYLPPSQYYPDGLQAFIRDLPLRDREPHALRFLVSFFNPLVGALAAAVFFFCSRILVRSDRPAMIATAVFAAGSLALPYSGTFFSEPLTVLFLLLSLRGLLALDPALAPPPARPLLTAALAGAGLGAAVTAHLSAILFVPFLGLWLGHSLFQPDPRRGAKAAAAFAAGLGLLLGLLALHNFLRFGDPLETGRNLGDNTSFAYGSFAWSWQSLYGLLFSPGKGLLVYCPAVILGGLGFGELRRRSPAAAAALALAVVFRVVFFAARTDWHGGFSIGPRYLLPAVPVLLLPLAPLVERVLAGSRARQAALFAAAAAGIAQQACFALGEIFSYNHMLVRGFKGRGINLFAGERLYYDWALAPARRLLEGKRGPFFLHSVPLSNFVLWLLLSAALVLLFLLLCLRDRDSSRGQ